MALTDSLYRSLSKSLSTFALKFALSEIYESNQGDRQGCFMKFHK